MATSQGEIWTLLANYLCGEITATECVMVELLLKENEELRNFYHQMELAYLSSENKINHDATMAFAKLDKRIKKSMAPGH